MSAFPASESSASPVSAEEAQADAIMANHNRSIHEKTDRQFGWLMVAQWLFGILLALVVSPRTWLGAESSTHPHVLAAIFLGGAITGFPAFLAFTRPGEAFTRHVIAAGQALTSALLIHLMGGRIEAHFHVFGSLAFLAFYRDRNVLLTATALIVLDHAIRGIWWPQSIFGTLTASPWRWVEHAAWVVFEDIFLFISIGYSRGEMSTMARRQAELRASHLLIEKSENRARSVINTVVDGIITIDERGLVEEFNPAAEQIFGYAREEVAGQNVSLLMPQPYRDEHDGYLEHYRRTGERKIIGIGREVQGRRKDGAEFFMELAVSEFRVGKMRMFTGVVRDISERKAAEAELRRARDVAERANRAKNEFLSRMSHELRTPLNGILGFTQLLEMTASLPARAADNVKRIHKAGEHLLGLINEVLDIASIEAGRLSLSMEGVRVAEILDEVTGLVSSMARKNSITLVGPKGLEAGLRVKADRQRLRQVILNLASNGIKYNRPDGELRFEVRKSAENRVAISVSDTGAGIPPEKLDRLFVPFDRLDAEKDKAAIQGTGLGLALSRNLVEVMGGSIHVESEIGAGTTFTLTLEPTVAAAAPDLEATRPGGQGDESLLLTVLYVEDNPDNLNLIEQIVDYRGNVRLISAIQGSQGIDLAREHRPDLIFLDIHLPDIEGDEVLQRLRADKHTRDTPIYILSADAAPRREERLKQMGAAGYLTKPLDVERFLQVLDRHLSKANQS